MQSLMLRAGLKKTPSDLAWLEQQHAANLKFLEGSQRRLEEFEDTWATKKRVQYQQQLERKAKRYAVLGIATGHRQASGSFPATVATRGAGVQTTTPTARARTKPATQPGPRSWVGPIKQQVKPPSTELLMLSYCVAACCPAPIKSTGLLGPRVIMHDDSWRSPAVPGLNSAGADLGHAFYLLKREDYVELGATISMTISRQQKKGHFGASGADVVRSL